MRLKLTKVLAVAGMIGCIALCGLAVTRFLDLEAELRELRHQRVQDGRRVQMMQDKLHIMRGRTCVWRGELDEHDPTLPYLYFITPTHNRPTQKADIVRLCQVELLSRLAVYL
jgi:hypothetical protein